MANNVTLENEIEKFADRVTELNTSVENDTPDLEWIITELETAARRATTLADAASTMNTTLESLL